MKKKLLIAAVLLGAISCANAQSVGDITKAASKASTTAIPSFDVASLSNQVMGVLSPKLKLTEAQKPIVNSLVNETLNKKKNILPTMATDKAGYTSKMTTTRESFISKMKKNISPTQFEALTALLPKSASAITPLAKMLY
jgi:ABC-type dipeptide/oligopeptide/nickel transport system permease component